MEVQSIKKKLALLGGDPLRTRPFPAWPVFDEREERGLLEVLHSGKWWRFSYGEGVELREPELGQPRSKVAEFQEAFARCQDARYGAKGARDWSWRRSHCAALHFYRYGQRGVAGQRNSDIR